MAASQSLQRYRFSEEAAAAMEQSRRLIEATAAQINIARELRETAGNLRQRNRDFRDFLYEQRVLGFYVLERLVDGGSGF